VGVLVSCFAVTLGLFLLGGVFFLCVMLVGDFIVVVFRYFLFVLKVVSIMVGDVLLLALVAYLLVAVVSGWIRDVCGLWLCAGLPFCCLVVVLWFVLFFCCCCSCLLFYTLLFVLVSLMSCFCELGLGAWVWWALLILLSCWSLVGVILLFWAYALCIDLVFGDVMRLRVLFV